MASSMKYFWRTTNKTEEDIIEALEKNDFDLIKTASALGYKSVNSVKNRINSSERLKAFYEPHKGRRNERNKFITDAQYLEAIKKSNGLYSTVGEILQINPNTARQRIANNPELKEAFFETSENIKDVAELQLFTLIKAGDFQAIKFYLSTKARDRGYGEKVEISATMDLNNNWNLNLLTTENLLLLENMARVALPKPEESEGVEIVDAKFIENPTDPISN